MGIILAFAPWIAYWILASNNTFETGAVVALVVSLVLLGADQLHHRRPKALDVATLVWFIALSVLGTIVDDHTYTEWAYALSNAFLALVVIATIVAGRPFTRSYAEEGESEEVRQSAGFRHATSVIAWAWAGAFVVMFVSSVITVARPGWSTWTDWVIPIGALVLAMKFTHWYPEHLQQNAPAERPETSPV